MCAGSFCHISLWPHALLPAGPLCPWDSRGKNTGVRSHSPFQGIFLTQESNLDLPHCRQILYLLRNQGSQIIHNFTMFSHSSKILTFHFFKVSIKCWYFLVTSQFLLRFLLNRFWFWFLLWVEFVLEICKSWPSGYIVLFFQIYFSEFWKTRLFTFS